MNEPYYDTGSDYASSDAQYQAYRDTLQERLYDAVFGNPSVFGRVVLIASFETPPQIATSLALRRAFRPPLLKRPWRDCTWRFLEPG